MNLGQTDPNNDRIGPIGGEEHSWNASQARAGRTPPCQGNPIARSLNRYSSLTHLPRQCFLFDSVSVLGRYVAAGRQVLGNNQHEGYSYRNQCGRSRAWHFRSPLSSRTLSQRRHRRFRVGRKLGFPRRPDFQIDKFLHHCQRGMISALSGDDFAIPGRIYEFSSHILGSSSDYRS